MRNGAVLGRQVGFRDLRHEAFGPHAIADQIGDRDHQQLVLLRELRERRHARHGAVVVHDFADHAGRRQPGDARQVDGRLGLSGAHQHAAVARAQREHVAGPREVGRLGLRIDRRAHRGGAIGRGDAGAGAALGFDRHAERGFEPRRVLLDHQRDLELVEPLAGHRQADQAAAVLGHEVDRLGRHLLGGHRQVAFVLAILVVDDDDHLAAANRGDGVFDRGERPRRAGTLGDLDLGASLPWLWLSQFHCAHDVLADHVALEVDLVALAQALQRGVRSRCTESPCTSNCRSPSPATVRLMPSTATDPLRMKYGASGGWKPDRQPVRLAFRPDLFDDADAIDVSEHEVAIEAAVAAHRPFEVHFLPALQRAEAS